MGHSAVYSWTLELYCGGLVEMEERAAATLLQNRCQGIVYSPECPYRLWGLPNPYQLVQRVLPSGGEAASR